MENPEQGIYTSREHKQSRYDKRLILKIVKEVENGLPRKEANRIYGLGKASPMLEKRRFVMAYILKTLLV